MKKENIKKCKLTNGITLIALVVTIVVLLILAGVTISLVFSGDGIIAKAKEAAEKTELSVLEEKNKLNELVNLMDDMLKNEDVEKDVVIPDGFYYVGGTIDTGIIISDNEEDSNKGDSYEISSSLKGNQFVWIPVSDYKTIDFDNEELSYTEEIDEATIKENEEIQKSIEKYGGYYIGRYETGIEDNKLVVQQGKETDIANFEEAVEKSRGMYENNTSVVSTLVHGKQWDSAVNFISKNFNIKDSSQYGNYANYNGNITVKIEDGENDGGFLFVPSKITFPAHESEQKMEVYLGTGAGIETAIIDSLTYEITDNDNMISNKEEIINSRGWEGKYIESNEEDNTWIIADEPVIKVNPNNTKENRNANIKITTIIVATEGRKRALSASDEATIQITQKPNLIQATGNNKNWQTNNIYDMAGNNYEWTIEKSNEQYVTRGGQYYNSGTSDYIAKRNLVDKEELYGYRVALYMK